MFEILPGYEIFDSKNMLVEGQSRVYSNICLKIERKNVNQEWTLVIVCCCWNMITFLAICINLLHFLKDDLAVCLVADLPVCSRFSKKNVQHLTMKRRQW